MLWVVRWLGGAAEGGGGGGAGGLRTDSIFYAGMASAPQQGQFMRGPMGGERVAASALLFLQFLRTRARIERDREKERDAEKECFVQAYVIKHT